MLTKGLGRPDCAAQMTGGEVRAATLGGACGGSGCRSFPCAWISRNDAVPCRGEVRTRIR